MVTKQRLQSSQADSEPVAPQTSPQGVGYGLHGHDFTLQAVMELQKSVGELNANLTSMRSSIEGMKSKVDDLVGWKHKILGGAAVLATVIAALGFLAGKASDYVMLKPSASQTASQAEKPAPAQAPAKP